MKDYFVVRGVVAVVIAASLAASAARAADPPLEGALSTSPSNMFDSSPTPVKDTELAKWVQDNIPADSKKLFMFAMCFGGNFHDNFASDPNSYTTSCNEPGMEGIRPGYSEGVPNGLKPGDGRTAQDAHDDAKMSVTKENPQTGSNPLNQFPLDPTKPNDTAAKVRSRHILIYAGDPLAADPHGLTKGDDDLRDRIKANFPGDSITTIGGRGSAADDGSGENGWDRQANATELKRAIERMGADIKNSGHSSQEQFIMVVLDHGSGTKTKELPPSQIEEEVMVPNVPTFNHDDFDPQVVRHDPKNVPGFSIFVPLTNTTHAASPNHYSAYFQPGDWTVDLETSQGVLIKHLGAFNESAYDFGDYVVGDETGEGLRVFFPIDEEFLLGNLFDTAVTVRVQNHTIGTPRAFLYPVTSLTWETGSIQPLIVPEPHSAAAALLISFLFRRCRCRSQVSPRHFFYCRDYITRA